MAIVDSPYIRVTLCTGSLGADPENDMVKIVHTLKGRINFVHFRNVLFMGNVNLKSRPSVHRRIIRYVCHHESLG